MGTVKQEREATHWSWEGPIKLEVVQCPTCGSVSKAKLKGSSVVIAPHPKCQLRAVRNVTRWMEQELEWVLVKTSRKGTRIEESNEMKHRQPDRQARLPRIGTNERCETAGASKHVP
jgi:hypothetical protein